MVRKKVKLFDVLNVSAFIVFALLCFYPFYYLILYSLSNATEIARNPAWLLPRGLSFRNYEYLFQKPEIYRAFLISASRTVIGTVITVMCCSFFAFLLTEKKLIFRRFTYRMLVLTMYLDAGLIPYVIVMRSYHLNNNYLLYIIPSAISAFYVILIKTYIEGIPASMEEAAMIDGAGYFSAFFRIVFPVCLPVVATVAIFSAVNQWNSWRDNFYLVRDNNLKTMQLQLLEYLQSLDQQQIRDINEALGRLQKTSSLSIKACISVITTLPILLVYPFFQRYFVKGILIGAVKG